MPQEHRYATLYDILVHELEDFAIFLIGPDGKIMSWNLGVERFFGYSEQEFVGRDFGCLFTPEDRAAGAAEGEMEEARRTGRASDVRWHLRKDGCRVFVEGVLTAIRDDTGSVVSFAKITRAVQSLHMGASMLSAILEGTQDAIYALDANGRFVFANGQFARLLDLNIDDIIGQKREEILSRNSACDMEKTDQSVMRGTASRLVEERLETKNHGVRVLLTTKAPWKDKDGQVVGFVAIAKDITSRKSHQDQRENLLRELRQRSQDSDKRH